MSTSMSSLFIILLISHCLVFSHSLLLIMIRIEACTITCALLSASMSLIMGSPLSLLMTLSLLLDSAIMLSMVALISRSKSMSQVDTLSLTAW